VRPAPAGALTAVLHVTDQATLVERVDRPFNFAAQFPPDNKGDVYPIHHAAPTTAGWSIADVLASGKSMGGQAAGELDAKALKAGPVQHRQLQREAAGKSVKLTGELTRGSKKETPAMILPVVLKEERRKPLPPQTRSLKASLTAPGTTRLLLPPLPANWESPKRQVRLELRDGAKVVWQGPGLPGGALVKIQQRDYSLTAIQ